MTFLKWPFKGRNVQAFKYNIKYYVYSMVTTYFWFDLLNFVCILFILNSGNTRFQTLQRDEHNQLGIPGEFPFKLRDDA